VTFGLIVLNGEPFVRYNLRALYPLAHQIVVVEGAAPAAAGVAGPDGHSTDGTLETLRRFKAQEDPGDKLVVVTAEDEGHPNGFWPGEKLEQSQAYARRATGNCLWQVDVDEFYQPEGMARVLERLAAAPDISAVTFEQITFWGGFDYWVDGWYLRAGASRYHRLFRWGPGYGYVSHRPPTIVDEHGRDLHHLRPVAAETLAPGQARLQHYSLVFPRQVREKCEYYSRAGWTRRAGARAWAERAFMRLEQPYRVHNVYDYLAWLNRYPGSHPPQIEALRADLAAGRVDCEQRPTDDVERLLNSRRYRLGRAALRLATPVGRAQLAWRRWKGAALAAAPK
jgi:hypothetical protein